MELILCVMGTVYRLLMTEDAIRIQYDRFDQVVVSQVSFSEHPELRGVNEDGIWNYELLRRLLEVFSSRRVAEMDGKLRPIYEFIVRFYATHGFVPTVNEISGCCYIGRSTAGVRLAQLEALGVLERVSLNARAYRLVGVFS